MKPNESHFTGNIDSLISMAQRHTRRERLDARGGMYFAHTSDYLQRASDSYKMSFTALETAGVRPLLSWKDNDPLYIDGKRCINKPFASKLFVTDKGLTVSRPFDIFSENTTGVEFACVALSAKNKESGPLSTLLAAIPRTSGIQHDTPLAEFELPNSVPLALICQDNPSGIVVCRFNAMEQQDEGITEGLCLTTLGLEDTEAFIETELPRIMAAMPLLD